MGHCRESETIQKRMFSFLEQCYCYYCSTLCLDVVKPQSSAKEMGPKAQIDVESL